jgi:His-Xaa-Ser system protein HxsD
MKIIKISNNQINCQLNLKDFDEETIRKSVYWLPDGRFDELNLSKDIWTLKIVNIKNDVDELLNWISESLNDFRLRKIIREKTDNAQDKIAAQAIKSIYTIS